MSIEPYQPSVPEHSSRVGVGPSEVDSWTSVLNDVADLASKIGNTEFVPESMRGKTAVVAAAILTGREMGIGPMTALQHIHLVKGKPGQSAQLMRALVQSAGHHIRYVETTDTRCVVEGRRRGDEDWERVVFTADQAKKAQIALGGYPEDKLVARATTRLCRRTFADCIGGMPHTVEELEDGDAGRDADVTPIASAPAPRQTVRRREKPAAVPPREAQVEQPEPEGPALPGEDGYGDPPGVVDEEMSTTAQNRKMHALFREAGLGAAYRDRRLRLTGMILGRELGTSAGLTEADADRLIDRLEGYKAGGDLTDALTRAEEDHALAEVDAQRDPEQETSDDDARGGS